MTVNVGDTVALVRGSSMPLLLRPNRTAPAYTFHGLALLNGLTESMWHGQGLRVERREMAFDVR